jgi:hypothetical protein
MLRQFALYKQCATPHASNVFLPTCSATALSDYFSSIEAISQYFFTTDNPLEAEYIRRDMEASQQERQNLQDAMKAVNAPWYQAGKTVRNFVDNLMGWEREVDPDIVLAEKLRDNSDTIAALLRRIEQLQIKSEIEDLPNMVNAYLDGVYSDHTAKEMTIQFAQNFEYAEGATVDIVPESVKDELAIKEAKRQQEEAKARDLNPIDTNNSTFVWNRM